MAHDPSIRRTIAADAAPAAMVRSMLGQGLVDELRLAVPPVIAGKGRRLLTYQPRATWARATLPVQPHRLPPRLFRSR